MPHDALPSPIDRGPATIIAIAGGILALAAAATGDVGTYLTGDGDMTLYYFAKDTSPGTSVCEGKCAEFWPPCDSAPGQWFDHDSCSTA